MRFTDLRVEGFGVWSGLEIMSLSPQLTVIYGANEAGKTTILECLRGVLYGFTPARRDRYLPPVHGGVGGGVLGLDIDRQHYEVARRDDGSRLLGGVTVTLPDGTRQTDGQPGELLGGADEALYTNVFCVALRELQELATLGQGQAAAWLYDLSTGLDGISISDVLRELRVSRARLISPDGEKSRVIELMHQRDVLRSEIDELASLNDTYWRLSDEKQAADDAIRAAEALQSQLAGELRVLDAALGIGETWRRRAQVESELAQFGPVGDFPPQALRRLKRIMAALRQARGRRARVMQRRQALRADRGAIVVNEPLWRQSARIAALAELEPWIATLDDQLRDAEQKTTEHERQLAAARAECGLPDRATSDGAALVLPAVAALRGPAKQLFAARKRLKAARDACRSLRATHGARRDEVTRALAGRGEATLAAALDKQGQLVAQYRRRLQLDDRLDQLALHRQELEEKHRRLIERQVMPLWLLIALAVMFVVGGGLVLAGLILPWGAGATILGALIAAAAVAGKFGIERSAANRLDATENQLKLWGRQLEQTKSERSELDAQLPQTGGSLAGRLQAAEAELASLEELLSLDARRQAADGEAAAADERLKAASEEYRRALRRWRQGLAEAGLPADISPARLKQIAAQTGSLSAIHRQHAQSRETRDRCRRELAAVATRIEQLAADAGWQSSAQRTPAVPVIELLRRLRRELAAQEDLVNRRAELDRQLGRLRRLALKYGRRARRLARHRRELFRAAGAIDARDFRRRAAAHAQLDNLLRSRATLTEQIQASLHGTAGESTVVGLLQLPAGQLEQQRAELETRMAAAAEEIKRMAEERGRIAREQLLLADDRRLPNKQLELSLVEERLTEAAARWRTLALAEHLIASVKEDYERHRQPEVLQDASRYFERMTEGRYRRVWTPLGENVLRVDDHEHRALPLEVLSTGAREQLFLALRLALVGRFARHGMDLPMVLDDVLVNFDARRAAAAASVFHEFAAAGHQVLLFTCHEHVVELFRSLRSDVRRLPANAGASPKLVGPEAIQVNVAAEPPRKRREKRPRELRPESDGSANPPIVVEIEEPVISITTDNGVELLQPETVEWLAGPPPYVADAEPSVPPPLPEVEPPPAPVRRHRADPPHALIRVRNTRRRRWSAEEFDGELADQVNDALAAAWHDGIAGA